MAFWQSVLCATDLSTAADEAIRQADDHARLFGATLTVLHVLPTWPGTPMTPDGVQDELLQRERLAAELLQAMSERVSALTGRDGDRFQTAVDEGLASERIVLYAEKARADLVVVGSTGSSRPGPPFVPFGGVTENVVRHCPRSVLVARPRAGNQRLIVATDFSEPSEAAIRLAAEVQRRRAAHLTVLHALDSGLAPSDAFHRLSAAVARLGASGEARVDVGSPADVVPRLALELQADLVIVGTRPRGGLRELILGSVAETIARNSPCSVLVVRAATP